MANSIDPDEIQLGVSRLDSYNKGCCQLQTKVCEQSIG